MPSSHVAPVARARHAHQRLRESGQIPAAGVPERIGLSWRRCLEHGLSIESAPHIYPEGHARLASACERNRMMMLGALPVIEALHEQIVDTQSMVVLTDATGFILHSRGDDRFLNRAKRVALAPGVEWSEQGKGTNAIGTALMERAPVVVNGPEHYLTANHFLTCSAAPILDPKGEVIGVLDVTSDYRGFNQHTMALVKMSVQLIENQLLATAFPEAVEVRIHSRPEFLGTLCEGILAFDTEGTCIAANRSACFQLGRPLDEVRRSRFETLFNQPVGAILDHALVRGAEPLTLTMHNGVKVAAQVRSAGSARRPRVFTYPRTEEPRGRVQAPDDRPRPSLAALDSGDPQLTATLDKLRRVIGWDIPILIHGETGTGKELLARALHEDGPRRKAPFVAVNCAAIPETLIESELFGYDEGAFTGARRKGAVGRVVQADGGTLFLDEVGDMPLALQGRLLRVLQERVVTPLGGGSARPVNISVICATHRKLKECVAAGAFRADLYYRLNGLCVTLPPLRLRRDIRVLIDRILAQEARGRPVPEVAPGLMALFERHPWPGNVRQLANLLRTALVMTAGEPELREEHLPQDFWDELAGAPAREGDAAPARAAVAGPERVEADLASLTREAIERAVEENHGNISAAARQLRISRNTLYRRRRQP